MGDSVLHITGEVTVDTPAQFNHWVEKLPLGGDATVDFSQTAKIDSSCVSLILRMQRRTQVNGGSVRFVNIPDQLMRLISLYGLQDLLDCSP